MARSAVSLGRSQSEKPEVARKSLAIHYEEVARVAYELFERRGGVHGYDRQDWLEAERIVRQRHGNGKR